MAARKKNVDQTKVVTTSSTIRIETPRSTRHPKPKIIVSPEINPVGGFVQFLRENAVVAIAVAFVIGQQVQGVVKQFLTSFVDPLSLLLFGSKITNYTLTLTWHGRTAVFAWGLFVNSLVAFIIVLAIIYAVIKLFRLDKFDKPKNK